MIASASVTCRKGRPSLSTTTLGIIVPKPRVPDRMTRTTPPAATNGAIHRANSAMSSLPSPLPKISASCGAQTHRATPNSMLTASGGRKATKTVLRMSRTRSSARSREIDRTMPVSAPSSAVLDRIVKRPMADTKAP
jgi:hypothetical protein